MEDFFKKGFSTEFRKSVMQTVKGGKVCININGRNGPYFKTYRALRQGDSLSPILFNLAVDALDCMLRKPKQSGHLRGVTPALMEEGFTHLQYSDDTVIMMDSSESSIRTMKLIL